MLQEEGEGGARHSRPRAAGLDSSFGPIPIPHGGGGDGARSFMYGPVLNAVPPFFSRKDRKPRPPTSPMLPSTDSKALLQQRSRCSVYRALLLILFLRAPRLCVSSHVMGEGDSCPRLSAFSYLSFFLMCSASLYISMCAYTNVQTNVGAYITLSTSICVLIYIHSGVSIHAGKTRGSLRPSYLFHIQTDGEKSVDIAVALTRKSL